MQSRYFVINKIKHFRYFIQQHNVYEHIRDSKSSSISRLITELGNTNLYKRLGKIPRIIEAFS